MVVMGLTAVALLALFLMLIEIGVVTTVLYIYNRVRGTGTAYRVASRRGWVAICASGIVTIALTMLVSTPTMLVSTPTVG